MPRPKKVKRTVPRKKQAPDPDVAKYPKKKSMVQKPKRFLRKR